MTSHDTKSKSKFNLNILPLSNQLHLTRTTMLNINFKNESLARFISHPSHPLKIINITRKKIASTDVAFIFERDPSLDPMNLSSFRWALRVERSQIRRLSSLARPATSLLSRGLELIKFELPISRMRPRFLDKTANRIGR